MTREDEVKELAEFLSFAAGVVFPYTTAMSLYDAGYRKVDVDNHPSLSSQEVNNASPNLNR